MRILTRMFVVLGASAFVLGCNQSMVNPNQELRGNNNSDTRKDNYHAPTASDLANREAKLKASSSVVDQGNSVAARSAASTTKSVAVLADPMRYPDKTKLFTIFMHTESDGNADHVREGGVWEAVNGSQVFTSRPTTGSNTLASMGVYYTGSRQNMTQGLTFNFARVELSVLPQLPIDYIVLRLSDKCPDNGKEFSQYFDDEDVKNLDIASINIAPGVVDRRNSFTRLAFCFVPKSTSGVKSLYYTFEVGRTAVFVNPGRGTVANSMDFPHGTQTLVMDSEDDNFEGHFEWEGLSPEYQARVQNIMLISSAAQTPFISMSTIDRAVGKIQQ